MTNRRWLLAAVAVVALLGMATSVAYCGSCGAKPKPKVPTCIGIVKSVDAAARQIVLTTGEGDSAKDVTMKVCPKAKVLVDGKKATLADVKTGAKAKACHNKDMVCVRIVVGAASCPKS